MPDFFRPCLLSIVIASLAVTGVAHAQEIYKWKNQDGTTHYSERPPLSELSSVEMFEVQLQEPVGLKPDDSYRSALELANSLQAGRLEREKLRLEKERLAQQNRQVQLDAQRYNETYRSQNYNDYSYYYPYRPRHPRPPHHGKPHPPRGQGSNVTNRVYLGR